MPLFPFYSDAIHYVLSVVHLCYDEILNLRVQEEWLTGCDSLLVL